jgi:hypothetical protein
VAPRANVTQRMSLALLEERTLHVPLVLLGSDVTSSARFEPQVELRAVLPTLLGRVEAALPAGVKARDLLSSDPAQHGEGLAYSEVGDMLTLCRGHWMLRFRTMVHHGTALNTDLTTFLMFPPERALSEQKRTRTYMLFNLEDVSPPLLDRARTDWSEALDLREAMIRLRTGPAEPHPRTLDPERLLELRMIASDGYW